MNHDFLFKNKKERDNKKEWLESMTDVFEAEQLLWSWYKHYKPELLYNVQFLYNKWKFHLSVFFNRLYKRYVDQDH